MTRDQLDTLTLKIAAIEDGTLDEEPNEAADECAYFDRFDICEAYYLYAMLYHGGQWSKEYAIFGRLHNMGITPRPGLRDEDDLSENGRAIFNRLVRGEVEVRDAE